MSKRKYITLEDMQWAKSALDDNMSIPDIMEGLKVSYSTAHRIIAALEGRVESTSPNLWNMVRTMNGHPPEKPVKQKAPGAKTHSANAKSVQKDLAEIDLLLELLGSKVANLKAQL